MDGRNGPGFIKENKRGEKGRCKACRGEEVNTDVGESWAGRGRVCGGGGEQAAHQAKHRVLRH